MTPKKKTIFIKNDLLSLIKLAKKEMKKNREKIGEDLNMGFTSEVIEPIKDNLKEKDKDNNKLLQ